MKKIRSAALTALLIAAPTAALAQSTPNFITGQVPTAAQWNSYFRAKQDVLNFVPLNIAGGFMTGKLTLGASTTSGSSLNFPVGVAPSLPNNGDMWFTNAGLFLRVNGATVGPLSSPTAGSFTATSPLAVTFPSSSSTNYALNFNSTLTAAGGNLGINLATANTWSALQTFGAGVTITNAFTATGLVKNADLVSPTITVNSVPCTLGASCTIIASAGTITVGSTTVTNGPGILYNSTSGGLLSAAAAVNNGVLTFSGTGVPTASTTLPNGLALGTPISANLANATGLPIASGVANLGTGIATFLTTPSSANLLAALTTKTGTGTAVFDTSPTITTPVLSGTITGTYTLGGTPSISGGSINSGIVSAAVGGSGVNNGSFTMTRGGNWSSTGTVSITGAFSTAGAFTQAGAFATTLTSTAITNATLPSGTQTLAALGVSQQWTAQQSFVNGALRVLGTTSGSLTINCAAVCGASTLTFPSGTTDFSSTGGSGQFVKQTSAGAPLTVAGIVSSDLPVATTSTVGAVQPDGSTITISGGIITASGSSATAVTPGTTTVGGGSARAGYALSNVSGTLQNNQLFSTAGGYLNKFRNNAFDVWQRGNPVTISSSGNYGPDGWRVFFTGGSSVTAQQQPLIPSTSKQALAVTGNASNTNINVRQRIESFMAAPLSGQTVTVQFGFYQQTGSSVTPRISTCYASASDNFSTCTADLAATNLTSCAPNTYCVQAYTFVASANAVNGYEVTLDCNSGFTAAQACIISQTDIRVTPGVATGINAFPPAPERRSIADELALNQRYLYSVGGYSGDIIGTGDAFNTTLCRANIFYKVTPRVAFTNFTPTNTGNFSVLSGGAVNNSVASVSLAGFGANGGQLNATISSGAMSGANACTLYTTNANATGLFSGAEL